MDLKVGDKVRVREWDDMVEEFGVDSDGDIPTGGGYFTDTLKKFCGKNGVVTGILDSGNLYLDDERVFFPLKSLVKTPDNINHPTHYNTGEIECIECIESAVHDLSGFTGFCTGNAIKYLFRWKTKGGVEDLEKAKWYIDKLIERAEGQDETT